MSYQKARGGLTGSWSFGKSTRVAAAGTHGLYESIELPFELGITKQVRRYTGEPLPGHFNGVCCRTTTLSVLVPLRPMGLAHWSTFKC